MSTFDTAEHLGHIAAHLVDNAVLARFASRIHVARNDDEVVVTLAGRSLSIRSTGQRLMVGSDDIPLAEAPAVTLNRVAAHVALRLSQMDGYGN